MGKPHTGIEPVTFFLKKLVLLYRNLGMVSAGFEPAHPKIVELESTALDHSAIAPYLLIIFFYDI